LLQVFSCRALRTCSISIRNPKKIYSVSLWIFIHIFNNVQAILLLLPLCMLFTLTIKFVWDSKPKARNLVSFTGTLFCSGGSNSDGHPEITQESRIGNCRLLLGGCLSGSLRREREREAYGTMESCSFGSHICRYFAPVWTGCWFPAKRSWVFPSHFSCKIKSHAPNKEETEALS